MKLTHFKIIPFILAGTVLLALSGCDGTTGTASDTGIGTVPQTAPVAVDDNAIGVTASATIISVVANDTDAENNIDVSSVQIVGTANAGDTLVVSGEGSWEVSVAGDITFTPDINFTADPTPISYTVSDDTDLVSNEATVTVDYPQTAPVAVDDDKNVTVTGVVNQETSVDVLANDTDAENDINASTIQIVGTTNPGDSLVVANEGTWSVTNIYNVRFTPEASFIGDPTPIQYTVSDDTGLVSNEANVTINYTQTYFENNTTYLIPEIGTISSDIIVANATTTISKVTVTIDIIHTCPSDLEITLQSPSATEIILANNIVNCNTPGTTINVTFDDSAANLLDGTSAPYSGSYAPTQPLANFDVEDPNGTWSLVIDDVAAGDSGTLNSWSISIE